MRARRLSQDSRKSMCVWFLSSWNAWSVMLNVFNARSAPLLMCKYANSDLSHMRVQKRGQTANEVTCCWQVYEDTLEGVYLLLRREMQEKLIGHERFWQVAKVQMTRVCTLEETAVNYVNWKMIETLPYYKSVVPASLMCPWSLRKQNWDCEVLNGDGVYQMRGHK